MSGLRMVPGSLALLVALVAAPFPVARTPNGPPEILVSRPLLEGQGLEVGDLVTLGPHPDGEAARQFRIAGSYEPVPDPFRLTAKRYEVRLHLPDLLALGASSGDPLSLETVDRVNLALAAGADASAFTRELGSRAFGLVAVPTAQAKDASVFVVLQRFHSAVAVVTVLGSSAFLLALVVMRADERRETAGILRLLGVARRRILLEVFLEGLLIALGGAVFGVALAFGLQQAFNEFFQWYYDTALVFVRVTPESALRCLALALPLGVLAGLAASWTLLRRPVLALLRR